MKFRRKHVPHVYRLGSGDAVYVPSYGATLQRLGFRRGIVLHLQEIHRGAKGQRKDRDSAIVVVERR